jgi:chorismate mutase
MKMRREMYTLQDKVVKNLLEHIEENETVDPEEIKEILSTVTPDERIILVAYNLAKNDQLIDLYDLISSTLTIRYG